MNDLMGPRLLFGTTALSLVAWGAEAVGTCLDIATCYTDWDCPAGAYCDAYGYCAAF